MSLKRLLWGTGACLALAWGTLYADDPVIDPEVMPVKGHAADKCCPTPCPVVVPPGTPPTPPGVTPPAMPPGAVAPFAEAPTGGTQAPRSFAPNEIGDLLGGFRSIRFPVSRVTGGDFLFDSGATTIINPKIAENNSPIPRDRVSFRYNHYHNALQVRGLSDQEPVFDPQIIGFRSFPAIRDYDVDLYTIHVEKTFLDGAASVEVRLPIATTLASNLDLVYGVVTGLQPATDLAGAPLGFDALAVQRTPELTLGNEDTEFQNMTVIFKALILEDDGLWVSAGLGLGIPTGDDVDVRVIDYVGATAFNNADVQRERLFHVENEIWSISPFVAFLAEPNERVFVQGFIQMDLPLNDAEVSLAENFSVTRPGFPGFIGGDPRGLPPPFVDRQSIEEQVLMHFDIGVGYWLHRCPGATISGIAPTVELHYTTALEDADIAELQRDRDIFFTGAPGAPGAIAIIEAPAPQVGNQRNRVDILNLTVGATVLLGDRLSVANGVAFPLKDNEDDRTFDFEYQLQLNWYFGDCRR